MAVVINEFEVMPQTPANNNQPADVKSGEKSAPKTPPTDYEVKKMLERRMERLERVLAH
jgi:hypothetical protein